MQQKIQRTARPWRPNTNHLGNIRVSYGPDEEGVSTILQEDHYYPFALKHTNYNPEIMVWDSELPGHGLVLRGLPGEGSGIPSTAYYQYKFNGMEWQDEIELNLYDMDMRDYDPAIGRWLGIDPVTHFDMSPYVGMDNKSL